MQITSTFVITRINGIIKIYPVKQRILGVFGAYKFLLLIFNFFTREI